MNRKTIPSSRFGSASLARFILLLCVWFEGGTAHAATAGAVVAWGLNNSGQTDVPVAAQSGVTVIAAGVSHTVALKNNGGVLAWGDNTYGQTAVPVAAQSGVVAIAAGYYHTVALKNDGSVVAWGYNNLDQSTVPVTAQSGVTAIAAGRFHTVALKNNGSVVAWGYNGYGQTTVPVAARSGVTAIAAGELYTVALKTNGSVVAWGRNDEGETAVPVAARSGVTAIAAGDDHVVALKNDGSVVAWGWNASGQTTVPLAAQSGVVAIAAGGSHTVALKTNGSVVAWGDNSSGQTTVPLAAQSGVTAVAAGGYHTVAIVSPTAPAITTQPLSQTVNAGQSANFAVVATGYPLNYQWRKDGTNLNGATSATYSLTDVQTNQAGSYTVVVSNFLGSVTSAPPAVLTVYASAPTGSIFFSSGQSPAPAGSYVSLCTSISGNPYPGFQWQFNSTNLPGQIGPCLGLSGVSSNDAGPYRLIASNSLGAFTSEVAVVSVLYTPPGASIYLNSGHTPTTIGSDLTLCSQVFGAPIPSVQWQFNGTNLPGQTSSCLNLSNLQTNQSGGYAVVASNILGVVTSAVAVVSVIEPAPVLAYFASGLPPLIVGSFQYLCAQVTLPEFPTLQWRFNGTNLVDATNFCYFLNPLQASQAGSYDVVARAPTSGVFTSPPIALTLYYAPPTQAQPQFILGSSSALVGDDVSLRASYLGSPCYVQWRFNGADLPAQTNASLAMLSISTNQAGQYSFTATNIAGMTTSTVVTLTVSYQPPIFMGQPASQSVVEGTTARFLAYARGGPPPDYFLDRNGTNVAVPLTFEGCCGASAGGFSLLDTTFADAGAYRIIASNYLGTATSAVATLTVTAAGPLDRWTQRNPLPQSQFLFAVAHSTNQFVAVGDRGTILTSPDGSNWALQNRRVDLPLYGVTYGDGLFVAVGDGGTILSSSDGTNWAYRYTAAATTLNAVTHADGHFVAVGIVPGLSSLILHSVDGNNWERIVLNGFYAQQCVAYGDGRFIAAGTSAIAVSTDGTHWTRAQSVDTQIENITYANGLYVAVGDNGSILVSADGTSWVARTPVTPRRLLGVTYGAGRFVAAGARGTMLTSTDTITWTPVASGTPDRLETIDFAGGLFIAAGENGTIITSTNGTTWTKQNFGITRDLDGMYAANGLIVVVGKGGSILTTTDGANYTAQDAGVTNDLHGVTWGGGLWVAVGEPGIVLTSSNAVRWTRHESGNTNSLKDATYAHGQWIVVGTEGTIVRSTNGVNWASTFTNPPYDLNDVAYGNGRFLIAGDGPQNQNGSLFESVDGIAWAQVNFYPSKNLRGILFTNDLFVITANDGAVVTTTQALSFNYSFPLGSSSYGRNLRAVTRAHGLWIVVGNGGIIATSPDLITWTRRASRTFENQHQIALLDGKLVVIGNRGTILQSGRFVTELETPWFVAGAGFRFSIQGILNQAYQIQASTNLVNWTHLLTFTNLAERSEYTDTNALSLPRQFYRLVEP